MVSRWLRAATLTLCGLVAACATSPNTRYYHLQPIGAAGEDVQTRVLGLGPIGFPDYLKRPQIVTQTQGSEVVLAEFDLWAEPLENAFVRVLASNLDGLLSGTAVTEFPFAGSLVDVDYRMPCRVVRFDVDGRGAATLEVQWLATSGEGEVLVEARRTTVTAQATDPTSYASIVAAQNETLNTLSREMAALLEPAMGPAPTARTSDSGG